MKIQPVLLLLVFLVQVFLVLSAAESHCPDLQNRPVSESWEGPAFSPAGSVRQAGKRIPFSAVLQASMLLPSFPLFFLLSAVRFLLQAALRKTVPP